MKYRTCEVFNAELWTVFLEADGAYRAVFANGVPMPPATVTANGPSRARNSSQDTGNAGGRACGSHPEAFDDIDDDVLLAAVHEVERRAANSSAVKKAAESQLRKERKGAKKRRGKERKGRGRLDYLLDEVLSSAASESTDEDSGVQKSRRKKET